MRHRATNQASQLCLPSVAFGLPSSGQLIPLGVVPWVRVRAELAAATSRSSALSEGPLPLSSSCHNLNNGYLQEGLFPQIRTLKY